MLTNPQTKYPQPPFQEQPQEYPGRNSNLVPSADYGSESYEGSQKLKDRVALITGADSGIGKSIAITFAKEGADIVISYLDSYEDANKTTKEIEKIGKKCLLIKGDIRNYDHCKYLIYNTLETF